ncbi:hypothetical protein PPHE_b0268 [Pseudoalteromonas phenolica O-BC30]|nr:hypothetical protein [Pseudoalteromonas phenolica O-BC30]
MAKLLTAYQSQLYAGFFHRLYLTFHFAQGARQFIDNS